MTDEMFFMTVVGLLRGYTFKIILATASQWLEW
jgi:hypothetical protein